MHGRGDGDPATGVTRDGRTWPLGTQADVAWINEGITSGPTIAAAIPLAYETYATVLITEDGVAREADEQLLVDLLVAHTVEQPWWLGYLDTGAHDVVFDRAPKVIVYSGWSYVLVQAGPAQAAGWREDSDWRGRLPDLVFPADRSWLMSMLWDDDWRCLGGPDALIRAVVTGTGLPARFVGRHEDAAPPGIAFS